MIQIYLLISSYLLVEISRAQNATLPTDILTNMKSSLEAAGAGAINIGPSGILGNLAGQFGVKINKQQTTSGNTAKLVSKRSISILHPTKTDMMAKLENTKLAAKSMKNCFGFPQNFPVINIVVTQPLQLQPEVRPMLEERQQLHRLNDKPIVFNNLFRK